MRFLAVVFTLLLFVSCGGDEGSSNQEGQLYDTSGVEIFEEDEAYVPEDPEIIPFDISELPSEWLLLSDDGDVGFAIYDYWDCQEMGLYFSENAEGEWMMEIGTCQDTEFGEITNFTAELTEGEGIHIVNGVFEFTGNFQESSRSIQFEWNQMIRQGHFIGTNLSTEYFVPREDADWYETVTFEREDD